MTSQGPYQDDLVRRMMIADERPLRDAMKADASSEDENVIGAGKLSDHDSQSLLINVKLTTAMKHQT